jgi:hypothetical protein
MPRDYRFPQVTTMGFFDFIGEMKRSPDVRVAVLGDSVTQGLFVDRDHTLPAYLNALYARKKAPVRAFNFGLSGAHGNDILAETAHITSRKAADVLVIQLSYIMYMEQSGMINWLNRYPELWKDPAVFAPFENDSLVRYYTRNASAQPPTPLSSALGSVWRLYGARDTYAAMAFDKTAPDAVSAWVDRRVIGTPVPPEPSHPELKDYNRGRFRAYVKYGLRPNNPQIRYLRLALRKAKSEGVPVIVVMSPIDVAVAERFGLLTEKRFREDVAQFRSIVESEGATFVEVRAGFPMETLGDFVHPLSIGYEALASRTAEAIAPAVADAERKRVSGGEAR